MGIIPGIYFSWLVICRDVMEDRRKKRKLGFPKQVNLGEAVIGVGCFAAIVLLWPLFVMISIGITWSEWKLGEIVLWTRNEKTKKEKVDDLVKKANKLGLILEKRKPKELKLKGT